LFNNSAVASQFIRGFACTPNLGRPALLAVQSRNRARWIVVSRLPIHPTYVYFFIFTSLSQV